MSEASDCQPLWWRAEDVQKGAAGRVRWRGQELCKAKAARRTKKSFGATFLN